MTDTSQETINSLFYEQIRALTARTQQPAVQRAGLAKAEFANAGFVNAGFCAKRWRTWQI